MSIAENLAEYTISLKYQDLGKEAVHEAKRRILDALGCAIAAYNSGPVKQLRALSRDIKSKRGSTLLGTRFKTTPELATFVNSSMVRYLDYMDTYFYNGEIVHPEDNLAAILSVAESEKKSGRDVLLATVLAYEVCCRLVDFANIRKRGWDHVIWITMSSALAASKLMGLSKEKAAQALSIGITSNIPLRQIRVGGLSVWKGLAVAYSSMAGVFSTRLAGSGITGPNEIFEGQHGFFNPITGKSDLTLENFCRKGNGFKILEAHIKKYPAEINSQSAIEAAFNIRNKIGNFNQIKEINIVTFTTAYEIIADKEKWHPTNRETADHSLPYIVCVALLDGEISEKQFSTRRIFDKKIKDLIDKVKVYPSQEFDREYYPGMPTSVEVVMNSDEKYSSKVVHPRGNYKNPMNDEELEKKFRELAQKHLKERQIQDCLDFIWNLEKQKNVSNLLSKFLIK